MKDSLFWIWLSLSCTPGSTTFRTLAGRSLSPYEIYCMSEEELLEALGGRRSADLRRLASKDIEDAKRINDYCCMHNIGIVCWEDDNYPLRLRQIENPPPLLYYTGRLPSMRDNLFIGVVGTRTMSEYGLETAFEISYDLAYAGATVVSGMALGIDGVASSGALCAGGKTVVVLGCGIDRTYPQMHGILRRQIEKTGAVITEFPPGTPPVGSNFPIRNRLISGLSNGVLVVEGDMKSGALITARRAIQQGRDLYAVPGNVGETNSEGPNYLIKNGAQAITCADDILKNYAYMYAGRIDLARLLRVEHPNAKKRLASLGVYRDIEFSSDIHKQIEQPATPSAQNPTEKVKRGLFSRKPKTSGSAIKDSSPRPTESRESASVDMQRESRVRETRGAEALAVYKAIFKLGAADVDSICKSAGIDSSRAMVLLTFLEIDGLVKALPGGRYTLTQ